MGRHVRAKAAESRRQALERGNSSKKWAINPIHQEIADTLYNQLLEAKVYAELIQSFTDFPKGWDGEIDLLGILSDSQRHFYEIKTTETARSRAHAEHQAYRTLKVFPQFDWEFMFVTGPEEDVSEWGYEVELSISQLAPVCHHYGRPLTGKGFKGKSYKICTLCDVDLMKDIPSKKRTRAVKPSPRVRGYRNIPGFIH
ncbi:hypothetical protein GOV11_00320 [Candidatus Woesearchaeota archaeon]|nr:hypothetical protein [Candidatus Woesearchaeota archaeon]